MITRARAPWKPTNGGVFAFSNCELRIANYNERMRGDADHRPGGTGRQETEMVKLILIDAGGHQVGAIELAREVKLVDLEALKKLGAVRARLSL